MRTWFKRWLAKRLPPSSCVQLNRKTIFILPTITGYAMGTVLILMLLLSINYQNSLAYALTFLLFSICLLTALHTWRNLDQLKLQAVSVTDSFVGEQASFSIQLISDKRAYYAINLSWYEGEENLQRFDANAQSPTLVHLPLLQSRRGVMKAGRIKIKTVFPLGIWQAWSLVDLDQYALVYPKPIEADIKALLSEGSKDLQVSVNQRSGADDYDGLRDWQKGESMQRVNWKVWSKTDRFVVNNFTMQQGSEQVLNYADILGDTEYRLSVLCFHVLRLSQAGQTFELQLPQQTIGPDQGLLHQTECLQALAKFGQ
ncbi:DUF58 domain-containing protein [Pseudomonas sp. F1_0610]|uniref:DUF58 domain-containing protein n=1 Tax=Pseudomonas sp. F1_0610 TaxID=3114284 RepID=UPI0039C250FB